MTTVPPLKSPWGVPARLPPLGLAYVAAALEKAGFEVNMLDNYQLNKPMVMLPILDTMGRNGTAFL